MEHPYVGRVIHDPLLDATWTVKAGPFETPDGPMFDLYDHDFGGLVRWSEVVVTAALEA